jgi:hypothetical protein
MSNPDNKVISIQEFYGGMSSDRAIGPKASFSYARAIEHRRNPSRLSVKPGPRDISGGAVNDLILNIVQAQNGNRYAYGDQGYAYKINTSNVVTYLNKFANGSDGLLYRSDSDACYFATQTDIRRYYPISGNPTFDVTYGVSRSADSNAYRTGGASTYSVPTAIVETQACSFQPDIEPFYSIKVNITTPGTGLYTLTLHDGLNNVLATATATPSSSGLLEFVFSSQIRALVKPNARTYHFHLTSSVSGGKIACSTSEDLNTADFQLWAYRLVDTISGFHPMWQFQQFTCIGNGNYLAVWEPLTDENPPNTEFQRHRLVLPSGYEVIGGCNVDGYAIIACAKFSSDGTKSFQEGMLFRWDGTSQTYEKFINISGGSPESLFEYDNLPYFYVNGALCCWPGGNYIVKVRTIADTETEYRDVADNTRAYPNMMTNRDNLLHCGYPSTTTNTAIEHGVHSWGSLEKNYPASWGNLDYVISTQTVQNTAGTLQLGCIRNFGDEMYSSWKDGTRYGLDIVDSFCDPAPVAKFRALAFDAGAIFKKKHAKEVAVFTETLPADVTITPVTSINGAADVEYTAITTGDDESKSAVQSGQFRDIVYGFDVACEGEESPVISCVALEWSPQAGQKAFN